MELVGKKFCKQKKRENLSNILETERQKLLKVKTHSNKINCILIKVECKISHFNITVSGCSLDVLRLE